MIQQRCDSVRFASAILKALNQCALIQDKPVVRDGLAKRCIMRLLQVAGAALFRILSGYVSIIEVIILDQIGFAQTLKNRDKVVLTMETEFQLSRRDTCRNSVISLYAKVSAIWEDLVI